MSRVIFPSFHFERDAWRASVVRSAWRFRGMASAGYRDGARWEQVKRVGKQAVKDWVDSQLKGASVTVVLIGRETATRDWVTYEIQRSCELGMGLVGVRIHGIKSQLQIPDSPGPNPFESLWYDMPNGQRQNLSRIYRTYDYVSEGGYYNLGEWVEEAARAAGR